MSLFPFDLRRCVCIYWCRNPKRVASWDEIDESGTSFRIRLRYWRSRDGGMIWKLGWVRIVLKLACCFRTFLCQDSNGGFNVVRWRSRSSNVTRSFWTFVWGKRDQHVLTISSHVIPFLTIPIMHFIHLHRPTDPSSTYNFALGASSVGKSRSLMSPAASLR